MRPHAAAFVLAALTGCSSLALAISAPPAALMRLASAAGRRSASPTQIPLAGSPAPELTLTSFGPLGEELTRDQEITVSFDRRPPAATQVDVWTVPSVGGDPEWLDPVTLRLKTRPLAYNTKYTVFLRASSELNGSVALSNSWSFRTRKPPGPPPPPAVAQPFVLTFDDCGSPDSIHDILAALAERGLKAIFFPTGVCRDTYPWLVPELLSRGHRVCNHTYSHPELTRLSDAAIVYQIAGGVTGTGCDLFRPPFGAWDGPRGRIAALAARLGYRIQMWDVDTRDWAGTDVPTMVAMIRARGGVVLMHMHPRLHTAEAIRAL